MPRIIVFIPDSNILDGIAGENVPGVSNQIGKVITWLMKRMERVIELKREEMHLVRPGSLALGEPKLIWVKILEKPLENSEEIQLRQKFNHILEETLVSRKNSYILDVGNILSFEYFDGQCKLTANGRINFWEEVDNSIRKFDKQEITLKPRAVVFESRQSDKNRKKSKRSHAEGKDKKHR